MVSSSSTQCPPQTETPNVLAMARSIQDILDHADELVQRIEDDDASDAHECSIEEAPITGQHRAGPGASAR